MKSFKLILKIAALCILAAAFFFGLFAFLHMNADPRTWVFEMRALCAFWIWLAVLIIIVSHLKLNKW